MENVMSDVSLAKLISTYKITKTNIFQPLQICLLLCQKFCLISFCEITFKHTEVGEKMYCYGCLTDSGGVVMFRGFGFNKTSYWSFTV